MTVVVYNDNNLEFLDIGIHAQESVKVGKSPIYTQHTLTVLSSVNVDDKTNSRKESE